MQVDAASIMSRRFTVPPYAPIMKTLTGLVGKLGLRLPLTISRGLRHGIISPSEKPSLADRPVRLMEALVRPILLYVEWSYDLQDGIIPS